MRTLITIALMFLLAQPQEVITARRRASSGGGGPAVVQSISNSAACNFGGCVATFAGAATSGNKIVVELLNQDAGSSDSCSDGIGGTLTEQTGSPQLTISGAGSGFALHELSETVSGSGATTITCSFSGSFAMMWVMEVSGSSGAATMQAASTSAYSFGNCSPSPSATPTASPSIAFAVYWADVSSVSPGAGWTAIGTVSTNGSPLWAEWKSVTGTSAVTATVTNTCSAHGPDAFVNIF